MKKMLKKPLVLLLLFSFLLTSIPFQLAFAEENPSVEEDLYPLFDIPGMPQVKVTPEDIAYFENKSKMEVRASLIPSIGTQKSFMAINSTNPNKPTIYEVKADLKRVNAHSYIYLEDGTTGITDEMITTISEQFEIIYAKETAIFGTEPDVDNDKRINILLLDIKDDPNDNAYIAGYFAPRNELPKTTLSYSNECEIFYMDIREGLHGDSTIPQGFKDTLAHEFQHMLQFGTYMRNISAQYLDPEDIWLDEGLAELSSYLIYGTYPKKSIGYMLQNYAGAAGGADLLDWKDSLANYGDSFLFALYLYDRFGLQFIKDLAADPRIGVDSINYQLMSHNTRYTFEDIFEQFEVTISADDLSGPYSIPPLRINSIRNELSNSSTAAPVYGILNLNTPTNIGTDSRYRSFFHILQGNTAGFNALQFSFANTDGDYYLIKSRTACTTFAQFATMQKTIEKIDVLQSTPWTTSLNPGEMCALLYIAKAQPIANTVTVTGVSDNPDNAPSVPQIVSAEAGSNYVTLKWAPCTYDKGIAGYSVSRKNGSEVKLITPQTLNVQNSCTDYTVQPNTAYTYTVTAVGYDFKATDSTPYEITTKPAAASLDTPDLKFLKTGEENGSAYIAFSINRGTSTPSLYVISASTDGLILDLYTAEPNPDPTKDRFYIGGLTPGSTYTIYANSKDSANKYSPRSNGLHIKAGAQGGPVLGLIPPTIPANIRSTEQTDNSITLEWDPSSSEKGILGYNVFRDNVYIGTTSTTSYKDTGLLQNHKYTYLIEAIDNSSLKLNSGYNAPFEASTKAVSSILEPDTTDNTVDNKLEITFTDKPAWRTAITAIKIGNTTLSASQYKVSVDSAQAKGKITINQGVIRTVGTMEITVSATNFNDVKVNQIVLPGRVSIAKSRASVHEVIVTSTINTHKMTITARDQYDNAIPNYRFYANVRIINNNTTNHESYTFDNNPYTADRNDIPISTLTDTEGNVTVPLLAPAKADGNDGIMVTIKTAAGGEVVPYPYSTILKAPPVLIPDTTDNTADNNLEITFADNPSWRSSIYSISVDNVRLASDSVISGKITIPAGLATSASEHNIQVNAIGYVPAYVKQQVYPGAATLARSSAEINAALEANTTRTITLTAKDQYGNPVPGHQFYADLTLIKKTSTVNEQYIFNGNAYTTNTANLPAGSPTSADGKTTVSISLPGTIDNGDGITVAIKLVSSGTAIKNISYTSTDNNNGGYSGGFGGGGGGAIATPTPTPTPTPAPLPTTVPTLTPTTVATPEPIPGSVPTAQVLDLNITLDRAAKLLKGSNKGLSASIPWDALKGTAAEKAPKGSILHIQLKKANEPKAAKPQSQLQTMTNAVYDLKVEVITGKKVQNITRFNSEIQIYLSLADYKTNDIKLSNLSIYAYNAKTKLWEYTNSQYNKKTKVITFTTAKTACFAVKKYTKTFTDINAHKNRLTIEKLAGMHLFDNMYNTKFSPGTKVTKAEFTVMLVRALGINTNSKYTLSFRDVPRSKYYYPELAAAIKLGLIKGRSGKYFGPNDTMTREQMAQIVIKAFKLSGRIPSEALPTKNNVKEIMTRAQAAILIDAMMEAKENTLIPIPDLPKN